MTTYLFEGLVHPERANISLQCDFEFTHLTSGKNCQVKLSIRLNQIAVWIESESEWDVFDLRNVVRAVVAHELEVVGFVLGYAYEVEIKRVLNPSLDVDAVFGIDIPCITERNKDVDLVERLKEIRNKTYGSNGVFLQRCFADLSQAMKNADDTGFYCYRAIEALRQHCIAQFAIDAANKKKQWEKVREVSGCSEDILREIKTAADPTRHGEVVPITADQRKRLFLITWDVVDGYLARI